MRGKFQLNPRNDRRQRDHRHQMPAEPLAGFRSGHSCSRNVLTGKRILPMLASGWLLKGVRRIRSRKDCCNALNCWIILSLNRFHFEICSRHPKFVSEPGQRHMEPTHLFELVIAMFLAIIALHYPRPPARTAAVRRAAGRRRLAGVCAGVAGDLSRSRAGARHLPAAAPDGRCLGHRAGRLRAPYDRHRLAGRRRGVVHLRRRGRRGPSYSFRRFPGPPARRLARSFRRRTRSPRAPCSSASGCRGGCRSCSKARACSTMRAAWCFSASPLPPA